MSIFWREAIYLSIVSAKKKTCETGCNRSPSPKTGWHLKVVTRATSRRGRVVKEEGKLLSRACHRINVVNPRERETADRQKNMCIWLNSKSHVALSLKCDANVLHKNFWLVEEKAERC